MVYYHLFQLTHSRGVRQRKNYCDNSPQTFQLTHSRGVRLGFATRGYAQNPISTHALTWSATMNCLPECCCMEISTHALTWSATECKPVRKIIYGYFNSRTHVECDIGCDTMKSKHINFNSRTHVECDNALQIARKVSFWISTHALTWSATADAEAEARGEGISTHALTWSATILNDQEVPF